MNTGSEPPPPPPPPINDPTPYVPPPSESVPAVPPIGNVAPAGRGPTMSASRPLVILVGLVSAAAAFFGVRMLLDKDPPTAEEVSASFVALPGFQYVEMPAEQMQPLRDAFATQNIGDTGIVHFDARQVTQESRPAAVVFVLSVDPDDIDGTATDEYVNGFVATTQATVQDLQIGDTPGHLATTPLGTVAFFFDDDGLIFNVVGQDPQSVETIASALESGNS